MAGNIRQTIICSVEALRSTGVLTENFIDFKERLELYENQIRKKNKEPGANIIFISSESSINDTDQRIFLEVGWIEASLIEEITDPQIAEGIQRRFTKTGTRKI